MRADAHILVIRFSAMGDVAMTVPVIKNLLQQNPRLQVTVVSNAFLQPLFEGLDRCYFYPAFLKDQHKGFAGLYRLYKGLKKHASFDAVADLHNVLRSTILSTFFRLSGYQVATVDKGRSEKKELTRKDNKIYRQLTPMHERYAAVFRKLGLQIKLQDTMPVYERRAFPSAIFSILSPGKRIIGIAPFAQYKEKMYPIEKMKNIVSRLAAENNFILLFGARGNEAYTLQTWETEMEFVKNIAGKYSLKEELAIISNLELMVSMDSANMHLASLFNVPVVSIWGATHHYAGFYGWGQDINHIVEIDLYCRPCSVFGNKPCYRGDHACMNWIGEDLVLKKIEELSSGII